MSSIQIVLICNLRMLIGLNAWKLAVSQSQHGLESKTIAANIGYFAGTSVTSEPTAAAAV